MSIVLALFLTLFTAFADDGSGLDPHGGPRLGATGDDGNGFDPHG